MKFRSMKIGLLVLAGVIMCGLSACGKETKPQESRVTPESMDIVEDGEKPDLQKGEELTSQEKQKTEELFTVQLDSREETDTDIVLHFLFQNSSNQSYCYSENAYEPGDTWERIIRVRKSDWTKEKKSPNFVHLDLSDADGQEIFSGGIRFELAEEFEIKDLEVFETVKLSIFGDTLAERIAVPRGYERKEAAKDSLMYFLRNYKLLPAGSRVHLFDGSEKSNQKAHVAVFDLPIENYDLQQCADSVMRVYGEYYYSIGAYDKIAFRFTNGFLAEYSKWREGYRIVVDGNDVKYEKSAEPDASYEGFVAYMKKVFTYAGTLSMESEAKKIEAKDMEVGDVFLNGGSPGHVVMIVDMCINAEGKKAVLLAQGYMPAQQFHILKNPAHEENPWYYEEEITYPFHTPGYTFNEGALKRMQY